MAGKDVGFVGLGIMGRPMARNLMKAGYSLTVYDVVGSSVEEIVTDGAKAASSAKEVAQSAPIVITMVPDSADSEAAIQPIRTPGMPRTFETLFVVMPFSYISAMEGI